MNGRIIPLIMCGGAGTRLWPASREVHPKQFLPLFGTRSTFQDTLVRVSDAALFERPVIITNNAYRFVVRDTAAFVAACREGLTAAEAGHIVTFGVQPERPATEYGYISPGDVISGQVRAVAKFVEKPDAETAAGYVKSGYLWNSGNFMFRAAVLLDEYRKVDTGSVQAVTDSVAKAGSDLGFIKLDTDTFASAKST